MADWQESSSGKLTRARAADYPRFYSVYVWEVVSNRWQTGKNQAPGKLNRARAVHYLRFYSAYF